MTLLCNILPLCLLLYLLLLLCYCPLYLLLYPVIAQFVARSKRLKDKGQTGEIGTFPTQCHLNGEVLSI
jgi:hypothetical protein